MKNEGLHLFLSWKVLHFLNEQNFVVITSTKAASDYGYSVNILTCLLEVLSALPLGASGEKKRERERLETKYTSLVRG